MFAHLVVDLLVAKIDFGAKPSSISGREHLSRICISILSDRQHLHLDGCEPDGQSARMVFEKDAREALEGAEEGAVDHHRRVLFSVLADVACTKTSRQVQVELDGSALPVTPDCIAKNELQLGSVEGPLARIEAPFLARCLECSHECGFRLVPYRVLSDPFFRAVGELDADVLEAEVPVDVENQMRDLHALLGDLFPGAEDMCVVLSERAHAHQAVERAGGLVAVHLAKLRKVHREVPVALESVLEDLHSAGAVHGLEAEGSFIRRCGAVHVLAELLEVPGLFPQGLIEDVRRVDLLIARAPLALAHVGDERLKQRPPLRMPEHAARTLLLEMEEVHLATQTAMIPLLGLLEHGEVGLQFLGRRPDRAVDALEHFLVRVSTPVGAGDPGQLEGRAELAGRREVRPEAEIDEIALAIDADHLVLREILDDLGLVELARFAEELDRLVALPDFAPNVLVACDDLAHACLDGLEIARSEGLRACKVIVEAVFDRRADGDLRIGIELLHGFGHDVSCIMTEQLEAVGVLVRHDLDARVAADRKIEIAKLVVDADRKGFLRERVRNRRRNVRSRRGRRELANRTIGEFEPNRLLERCITHFDNHPSY